MSPHDGLWKAVPIGTLRPMEELFELHYDELAIAKSALKDMALAADEVNDEHLVLLTAYIALRDVMQYADARLR